MKLLAALLAIAPVLIADGPGRIASIRSDSEFALSADPDTTPWRNVKGVFAENNPLGEPTPANRYEIRSRWTDKHLYFLFICPYTDLYLKPNPTTTEETMKLWEWDVVEIFAGADFENIKRYREYQVSPQGEWIDLDINSGALNADKQWLWNSGFTHRARISPDRKIWYAELKIPFATLDERPPREGNEIRINFYRFSGRPPQRVSTAWQPTGKRSHHVPEAFGRLVLSK